MRRMTRTRTRMNARTPRTPAMMGTVGSSSVVGGAGVTGVGVTGIGITGDGITGVNNGENRGGKRNTQRDLHQEKPPKQEHLSNKDIFVSPRVK